MRGLPSDLSHLIAEPHCCAPRCFYRLFSVPLPPGPSLSDPHCRGPLSTRCDYHNPTATRLDPFRLKNAIPPTYRQHIDQRHRVSLAGSGISPQALLTGLALVVAISLAAPYSLWIAGSSELTWSYFPTAVGAPFLLLVLANAACHHWLSIGLDTAELVTIAIMGLAASGMPIFVVGYILSIVSKPYYGALPQNKWAEIVQPHLPTWAVPSPQDEAMRFFYEGLPNKSMAIPWGAWLGPLLWWLALILALYFACFCAVVILRRQWIERERLSFPLTEVPLMLTRPDPGHALPAVLRSKVFWLGCAVPLSIILFNMLSYFHPGMVQIPFFGNNPWRIIQQAPPINLLVYFPVIGFMYLVPTAVSFSIWFFFLLHIAQSGLLNRIGPPAMRADPFVIGWSALSWQSWGAFVAMVLWSLWMARHHLASVWRQACGRPSPDHTNTPGNAATDTSEIIPYSLAVWGGLASLAFIWAWLWRSGLAPGWAALYLVCAFIIFLGLTRLVVQSGMHYLTTPMTAQGMVLALSGSDIGPHSMVALALSYGWCGDVQSTFMPTAANALKLHDHYAHRRNLGLVLALGLAVSVSFLVTAGFMLYLCYDYGAINLRSWFFNANGGAGGQAFDSVVQQLRTPFEVEWTKLRYFGGGAFLYLAVAFLHLRFAWWPLHPVGLAVASIWILKRIAFSVFLAWGCKRLVLRLGGVAVYQRLKPFFLGLVVGFFIGVGLGFVADVVFFLGKGHPILHG
jgi:hypothetical protein